jgi:hypothetical protein
MKAGARKLAAQGYRRRTFESMSALERIRFTFDVAVQAANEGDANRLRQALTVLRKGVNFHKGDPLTALGFLRIFLHCEEALREREDFAEVSRCLTPLRNAWHMAEPKSKKIKDKTGATE